VTLTETGEARVNGYLFVLERSLKTFLPPDVARDAVREIDSHLRERIVIADGAPNERAALEKILGEPGPPLRVAQAYSAERTIDEAVTTGRLVPMARAIWHVAASTLVGSAVATGLFSAYAAGIAFIAVGLLKPIFPNNVGLIVGLGGVPTLGAQFPLPPGAEVYGGYWIIPVSIACGVAVLVVVHKAARRYLASWRKPPQPAL
jgi:Predicted membrane protein